MRVVVLLSLAAGILAAQSDVAQLDQIAAPEVAKQKIPGLAVVAVKEDRVVYAKGFGAGVTPDTLFQVGSMARMLTAVAAVELSQQGRLRMDAPLDNYLFGLSLDEARMTVRQILASSAGPNADVLAKRLLETIRSKPLSAIMEETVLGPVGMKNTTFSAAMAMTFPLALGHTADGVVIRPMPGDPGPPYSSANDFSRFMLAYLNEGKRGDDTVLSASAIAELGGGQGLDTDSSRGVRLMRHSASVAGFESAMIMSPEFKTGVIVMADRSGADVAIVAKKLLEALLPVRFPPAPVAP